MDTNIKEEYQMRPGWWQKYGHLVLSFGIVVAGLVVAVMMIVFAYQWGIDMGTAPEWVKTFAQNIAQSQAPPTG